jgi:hypothetical protein
VIPIHRLGLADSAKDFRSLATVIHSRSPEGLRNGG